MVGWQKGWAGDEKRREGERRGEMYLVVGFGYRWVGKYIWDFI